MFTAFSTVTRRGALGGALLGSMLLAFGFSAVAATVRDSSASGVVTSRLGISAGDDIAEVPLGSTGAALEGHLPFLFQTAAALGVRIETASVGQGFFAADGELLSERDLDLVVTGRRVDVEALAATLGREWEQTSVFIFHPAPAPAPAGATSGSATPAGPGAGDDSPLATSTLTLPGGADALTDAVYAALVTELADGGHVRYAGPGSLLFVANTGGEPEGAFTARMERVRLLLAQHGVPSGYARPDRAVLVVADGDSYDSLIAARDPAAIPIS